MNERPLASLLRQLRSAAAVEAAPSLSDAELLRRWVEARDEAAFEVLVWRHGPLVLGVCRRLLRRGQDVEDAFQATFLILVRKAGSVRRCESVGAWLYRVAVRVALRARAMTANRAERQADAIDPAAAECNDMLWRDLRPVLDEEVHRLPELYRTPFVLCYLQGRTNAEAAAELGCPVGTILSRLSWARERLRGRLTKRGIALAGALALATLTEHASAAVPAVLVRPAVEAAVLAATGKSVVGAVSAQAVLLTEGVLNAMAMKKWAIAAVLVLMGVSVLGTGSLVLPSLAGEGGPPRIVAKAPIPGDDEKVPPLPNVNKVQKKDWLDVPSPVDGILLVVGTEIKEGEKVAAADLVLDKAGGVERRYRRLREGDKVERNQLLARLEDRKAVEGVRIAEAKLEASKATLIASTKIVAEAQARFARLKQLLARGVIAKEELEAAELAVTKYTAEVEVKKADVAVAEAELRIAKANVEMHEIRSPLRGTVMTIHLRPGEAVKKFEAVVRIRVEE